MAKGPAYKVQFRRKREKKTDYRSRLKLLLSGKPRLVVRRSLRHITVQLVENKPAGDITIASAHSSELDDYGWKGDKSNLSSAYLTGLLCGIRAVKKKKREAVLDIGLITPVKNSKVFAALKGALDAGMDIPNDPEMLPDDARISGEHQVNYAKILNEDEYKKRFSGYNKRGLKLTNLPKHFEDIKKKIKGK